MEMRFDQGRCRTPSTPSVATALTTLGEGRCNVIWPTQGMIVTILLPTLAFLIVLLLLYLQFYKCNFKGKKNKEMQGTKQRNRKQHTSGQKNRKGMAVPHHTMEWV